jgi:phage shock protein A
MSILKRMGRAISSNVNSVLDKVENPEKLAELALEEMDRALRQAKRAQAEARGEAKAHERKAKLLREDAEKWYQRAAVAIRAGDESLAREVLDRRHKILTEAVAEEQAAVQARTESDEIGKQLVQLQAKRDIFAARKGTAATAAKLEKTGGRGLADKLGATGRGPTPLQEYEEIERRVENQEAEREIDDLLGVGQEARLEGRFRSLDADPDIEDELAALKRRLGGPPTDGGA